MRLLESTETSEGSFKFVSYDKNIPRYAILSHTWGADAEEVSYKDIIENTGSAKIGYEKLRFCARRARDHGLHYFWVDTCCINKSDLNELSESINSMFRWYQASERCFVYLSGLTQTRDDPSWKDAFKRHRWFTRGWTLQELVAPRSVEFFNKDGIWLGDKRSLEEIVHEITGIAVLALQGRAIVDFDAEERFKWATTRQTKKPEDWAYCLIGIFNVSMSLIYGEGREHAVARLKKEIVEATAQAHVLALRHQGTWLVPFERNPSFTGRESELLDLRKKLFVGKDYTSKVAITGLGGVGKTQLVIELLYRTKIEFSRCSIIWIPATSKESLEQGYLNAAKKLGIPGCEAKDANVKNLVRDYLSDDAAEQWLLIFDNADDIGMWMDVAPGEPGRLLDALPRSSRGSIVFTSRDNKAAVKFAGRNVVHLSSMDEAQSLELLEELLTNKTLSTAQRQDAINLVSQLCCLPLAIVQAAMYINTNDIGLTEYLALLGEEEQGLIDLLSEDFEDDGRYPEVKNPIATTWLISFNSIRQHSQLAAEYLSFMGCVDSKDIPLSMLPPAQSSKAEVDAIGNLQAFSFITRQADNQAVTLHRLVHLATRNWLRKEGQLSSSIRAAVARLVRLLDEVDEAERAAWRSYMPHAAYIIDSGALDLEDTEHEAFSVSCACSALKTSTNRDESDDAYPDELHLLKSYAICLDLEGRFQEAETRCRKLMETLKWKYGENHLFILQSMSQLATILHEQGHFAEAEKLYLHVLEKLYKKHGDDHEETLKNMNNLANNYQQQGRLNDAEKLQLQASEGRKRILGKNHPSTLSSMHNLAVIYCEQGRWNDAEKLQLQALEGRKRILGKNHPSTLSSMNNLANNYYKQGRLNDAEKLQLQALEGCKRILGKNHPDTLNSMHNLALVYHGQGRWNDAEELKLQISIEFGKY